MEPMNLGSPAGSPSSPVSPFLPAYLMGENVPGNSVRTIVSSPTSPKHVSFLDSPELFSKQSLQKKRGSPENTSPPTQESDAATGVVSPPTTGLFDTLYTSCLTKNKKQKPETPSPSTSANLSALEEIEDSDGVWVTVFGFLPASVDYVVAYFMTFGNIVEKRVPRNGCNWINFLYRTRMEAHRALCVNGKIIGKNMMIGVLLCKDKVIANEHVNKENESFFNKTSQSQFNASEITNLDSSCFFSPQYSTPKSMGKIRPLGQSFTRTPQPEAAILPQHNTPQKSTSIVSKAMEYIMGW